MDFKKAFQYTKNLTLLYVEDNEQILNDTKDIFEDFFLDVITAVNGENAIELYKNYYNKHNKYIDLIITDINMPIMDGRTLIKKVHEVYEEQSIIVISAHNESSKLIDLIQIGINNFILKPIESRSLINILHSTCKNIYNQIEINKQKNQLVESNKYLDTKVQELLKEVEYTQKVSIETIANMVESYDDETGTHVKRIENYTALMLDNLPEELKFDKETQEFIPFASILHDIGKLIIPKTILTKNSKLTYEEFEVIKTHAKLGGDVLKRANNLFVKEFNKDSYLKLASDIAMYHHEKWDGTGYPEGLSREEIPKAARIVAIVDVYDALRSTRCYKDGFSHEKALDIIKERSS